MAKYLIGYDISDDKRLQRVYRKMLKYATPIQFSVFLFDDHESRFQQCLKDILLILNEKEDDLRIYPLAQRVKSYQLGRSILPEGILWLAL